MGQASYYPPNTDLGAQATITAAAAGTFTTSTMNTPFALGLQVRLYVSAASGTTPTVTITLQGFDPASGQYFTIGAANAAMAATAGNIYTVTYYPGIGAGTSPNTGQVVALPPFWRLSYTIAGTTPSVTGIISAATLI